MDLKELQEFIKSIAKSGATEVDIETGDLKLSIKTPPKGKHGSFEQPIVQQILPAQVPVMQHQVPATIPAPVPVPAPAATETKTEDTDKYVTIKSPMVGTFYRRPSPDKPFFATVGDEIAPGKVIAIIEAMKLFNEIEAEISGKIVQILVEDSEPVEFDQPIFLVDPS